MYFVVASLIAYICLMSLPSLSYSTLPYTNDRFSQDQLCMHEFGDLINIIFYKLLVNDNQFFPITLPMLEM